MVGWQAASRDRPQTPAVMSAAWGQVANSDCPQKPAAASALANQGGACPPVIPSMNCLWNRLVWLSLECWSNRQPRAHIMHGAAGACSVGAEGSVSLQQRRALTSHMLQCKEHLCVCGAVGWGEDAHIVYSLYGPWPHNMQPLVEEPMDYVGPSTWKLDSPALM